MHFNTRIVSLLWMKTQRKIDVPFTRETKSRHTLATILIIPVGQKVIQLDCLRRYLNKYDTIVLVSKFYVCYIAK